MRVFGLIVLAAFIGLIPARAMGAAASPASGGAHPHTICLNCHAAGEAQSSGATSQKRACIDCHTNVLQMSGAAPSSGSVYSRHISESGPGEPKTAPLGGQAFDRLDCLSCHVPHYQGEAKLLRLNREAAQVRSAGATFDRATQLCFTCHPVAAEVKGAGRGYMRHPVGIAVGKPGRVLDRAQLPPLMDVKGTADPSDDVIGCTTCHHPHESKNSFLLRWSLPELSPACLKCHPEVAPAGPASGTNLVVRR